MTNAKSRPSTAFSELMAIRESPTDTSDDIDVTGQDPFFRTPFRIGEVVSSALIATGVAINDVWELRGNPRQQIDVGLPEAAATLRSMDYTRERGADDVYRRIPLPPERAAAMDLCRPYQTRDGRWYVPHFSLGLGSRVLTLLDCKASVPDIAAAVARWDAEELDDAIASVRACGGIVRTREEWLSHPQGAHLADRPVVNLTQIGPSAAEEFHPGPRPLSGVRVLDLTRIIAGPVSSRGLAEHGADVLMVTAEHLPQGPEHVRDTSHGKRSCFLDLKTTQGAERFAQLVQEADVLVNSYRPGALDALGFSAEELARLRPGLVQVSVSCYGRSGPLASRGGWEQIAQAVTGICDGQGTAVGLDQPELVSPLVCDFTTGYLAAYGALLALARRAARGGSWHVEVSLSRSAMFLQGQGLMHEFATAPQVLSEEQLAPLHVQETGVYGDIRTLGPVLRLSNTPPYWERESPRLGSHPAEWLPR